MAISVHTTVIAGEHHVDVESGDEVFVRIKEFIPHPDYNFFGSLWSNDIALLILEEPLPLGPRPGRAIALKAAKLTEEEIVPGTSVTVMGFGHLKYGGNESKVLRKGDSGGPVVLTERPDVVVGTVCGGYKCGEKPGVYSNMYDFVDWVNANKVD
ncbi:unnamed protein product [Cyprideis torosa]|uniref:Uncharacterized protein n=1 Tax=Cyprideis torosa TaxID=163714 RepID=A0A7R8WCJ1_9CRUS|nr:unnamed protein product [Cyprideis torosa]CAG0890870.1 unnamed protein product [Cyprideis torosa]